MEDESIYQVKTPRINRIEDNITYQENFQKLIKEVSYDEISILLKLFLDRAAVNMGKECYDAPEITKESIVEFIIREFKFMPIYRVGSAIIRGSLDDKSPAKLTPKVVRKWLIEDAVDYNRNKDHLDYEERMKNPGPKFDLLHCPIGSAICRKIDMYNNGMLSIDDKTAPEVIPADNITDWDDIPLKKLAESITGEKL